MPEIKKTFLRGRMNKDLDERLLPDGEYRDALNVQVSSSEDSNAGTIQNVLGNRILKNMSLLIGESKCVGSVADTENDKLYWFFKGINTNTKQGIIEYDTRDVNAGDINANLIDSAITPLIIDTAGEALKFTDTQITSIQVLDKLLMWTDNVSEPKLIDLNTFETYNTYSTKSYSDQTKIPSTQGVLSNMEEQHLTLIKQKPSSAPIIALTNYISAGASDTDTIYEEKFIRFGYRWRFTNGQYSAYSPFSEPVFDPRVDSSTYFYNVEEGYNERMVNNIQKITISGFDVPDDAAAIDILYKEAGNNNVYVYKTITGLNPAQPPTHQINNKEESIFSVLPEEQLFRAYDNVPVKAKALDIIANRVIFGNYTTGINIGDYSPTFTITESTRAKVNDADNNVAPENLSNLRTIKSGRKYQVGVVFEDIYGRQSPVYTSEQGVYRKSFDTYDGTAKALNVELTTMPTNSDGRIHKYRYFIKESSEEYYNFIIDAVYDDEENEEHVWLVIPTYEINKIKDDDTIILKKLSNGNSPIGTYTSDELKYKVLDISGQKPDSITSVNTFDGKFFVKIKANAASTLLKQSIGTGGADGVLDDSDFNYYTTAPSNLSSYLFLGEADVPNDTSKETYLYKDGQIHYYPSGSYGTSLLTANANSAVTNPTTSCGSITGTWQQLTTPNINGYVDGTIGTINEIWVELDGNGFPRQFYVCYGNGVTATNATPAVFETVPDESVLDIYYETEDSYLLSSGGAKTLRWYNAFDFGDGVESNRIKDDFNEDLIDKQVRVSAPSIIPFNETTRKTGLIYSGVYNSRTNINYLNQFPPGGGNTKDINPDYGSIQLLFAKTTDLIALCEDKIVSIQAQRDLLFNADGTTNLVATAKILGSAAPYSGDYGISKNPESFAFDGNTLYWADSARNAILRLSKNGITVISSKGMKSWFRDKFNQHPVGSQIFGIWDKYTDQYLITLAGETFSFKENVDGWVSRLDFEIENGISINGIFFTFNGGNLYQHHHPAALRNNFFGIQSGSSVKLILNQEPSEIKNYKTISYEGTQAKQGAAPGWDADIIETDQQQGQVLEFIEKEGKWFANIAGTEDIAQSQYSNDDLGGLDSKEFNVQGLGNIVGSSQITTTTTAGPTTTTTSTSTTTLPPTTTTTTTLPPTTTTTTAPVGDYTCSTQTWATATYNGATGAITVTPILGTTTIHSYTPTTATANTGNVLVSYVFSDSNPSWNNTGTQLTCNNALTVSTTYTTTTTTTDSCLATKSLFTLRYSTSSNVCESASSTTSYYGNGANLAQTQTNFCSLTDLYTYADCSVAAPAGYYSLNGDNTKRRYWDGSSFSACVNCIDAQSLIFLGIGFNPAQDLCNTSNGVQGFYYFDNNASFTTATTSDYMYDSISDINTSTYSAEGYYTDGTTYRYYEPVEEVWSTSGTCLSPPTTLACSEPVKPTLTAWREYRECGGDSFITLGNNSSSGFPTVVEDRLTGVCYGDPQTGTGNQDNDWVLSRTCVGNTLTYDYISHSSCSACTGISTTTTQTPPTATITGPTQATIGQSIILVGEDNDFTGSSWSWTATTSPQGTSNANGFAVKQIEFTESYAGSYTYQVTIDGTVTDTHDVIWLATEYYTLQQCFTLATGIITSQSTITLGTWNVGDRIKDNTTDMYYKVTGTTQVYQGTKLTNVTNTGQTNCPSPPTYYYGLEHCTTNTLYRSIQGSGSGLFSVNDIVESNGIQLRVISTNATVNQYTQFGVIQPSNYTTCPLGTYTCNTYGDWVTLGWNSATGVITCTPTRSTTTVHSFSPQSATAGSGNVFVTFTFSDNQAAWDNTNAQVTCSNGASINTGTGGTTHYASFVTCGDPTGQLIWVESSSPISASSVISNGSDCFQWTSNNLGTPRQDISNYTVYNTFGTVGANCTDCASNLPTTTTTSTTAQTCFAIDVYYTNVDPATSNTALNDLCGNGALRTIYGNGNGLANSTALYTNSSCTSLASGTRYYSEAPGGGNYYRWNGVSLTLITSLNCP
jgi:hypothetical protein